jgi:hypothetical protein
MREIFGRIGSLMSRWSMKNDITVGLILLFLVTGLSAVYFFPQTSHDHETVAPN